MFWGCYSGVWYKVRRLLGDEAEVSGPALRHDRGKLFPVLAIVIAAQAEVKDTVRDLHDGK